MLLHVHQVSQKRTEAKKAAAIAYSMEHGELLSGEAAKAEDENDVIKPPAPITTFEGDKFRSKKPKA